MITAWVFWAVIALGAPVFWAAPQRSRPSVLAAISIGTVTWFAPWVGISLLAGTLAFFFLSRRERTRRFALVAFSFGLLGALFTFKYAPSLGLLGDMLVPLGLSFFTFKLLHYTIETARGNLREHTLSEFLSWVFLFPAFTAGPIERFDHFLDNREATLTRETVAIGLTRIAHGVIKKTLFADLGLRFLMKAVTADSLLARLEVLSPAEVWRFAILSFLYLYMDFSGYSDIAIGASRLFGVRLAENFSWPILARSPAEFWRRWHISLSSWCQGYVYLPVLLLSRSPYLAVFVTFSVMGLWHAASPLWLAWGLWHALGLSLTMLLQRLARARGLRRGVEGLGSYATAPLTFAFVVIGHLLATVAGVGTLESGLRLLARLFGV